MASVEYDVAFAVAVDKVSSGQDVENTGPDLWGLKPDLRMVDRSAEALRHPKALGLKPVYE